MKNSFKNIFDSYYLQVLPEQSLHMWTDSQLAFIIGHEMGHHILDHHMETFSWLVVEMMTGAAFIFLSPRRLLTALIWFLIKPFRLLITFPIKRRGEFEADEVGLEMMIKAGYNPDQVLLFWDTLETINPSLPGLQFLADHPTHQERKLRTVKIMKGGENDHGAL